MEANTPLHLFLHSTLHTLIGLSVITLPGYNNPSLLGCTHTRNRARSCVCVCGKTASCASLQVSPLHHLIKGAEKAKETTRE